jgi:hypothetical protein
MPLIRVQQTDVGQGSSTILPDPRAAGAESRAVSQLASEATRAALGAAEKIKKKADGLTFIRESAEANQIWGRNVAVIGSELERAVRDEGLDRAGFEKRREELTKKLLAPHANSFSHPNVRAGFAGNLEGFRSADAGEIFNDLDQLRSEDALGEWAVNTEELILDNGPASASIIMEDAEAQLRALEAEHPHLKKNGSTAVARDAILSRIQQGFMAEMGAEAGERLFLLSVMDGSFDALPKSALVSRKSQAMGRLHALSAQSYKTAATLEFTDFVETSPFEPPLPLHEGKDLDVAILMTERIQKKNPTADGAAALKNFRAAQLVRDGVLRNHDIAGAEMWGMFEAGDLNTPYVGVRSNLRDKQGMRAVENFQSKAGFEILEARAGSGDVRKYMRNFARTHGEFTPVFTEWVKRSVKSPSPNAPLLIELAQAKADLFPGLLSGQSATQTGKISPSAFDKDTHTFFSILNKIHAPGDNPMESVESARLLMENADQARAQMKFADPSSPLGQLETEETKLLAAKNQESADLLLNMFKEKGLLVDTADAAVSRQMMGVFQLELEAAYQKFSRGKAGGQLSEPDLLDVAGQVAFDQISRSFPAVQLFPGVTYFNRELQTVLSRTDDNGVPLWTKATLGEEIIVGLIEGGVDEKTARSPSFQKRLRFVADPERPDWFRVWRIGDPDKAPLEREGDEKAKVLGDRGGRPQVHKLDYEESGFSAINELAGLDAMDALFRNDRDSPSSGLLEENHREALLYLFTATGEDYLTSREFLGFKPSASIRGEIRRRIRGVKDDRPVAAPFSHVAVQPAHRKEVDDALALIDPDTDYGLRSNTLRMTHANIIHDWGTRHGISDERVAELLDGAEPTDETVWVEGGGGLHGGVPSVFSERDILNQGKQRARSEMDAIVRAQLGEKTLEEIFTRWWKGGNLPSDESGDVPTSSQPTTIETTTNPLPTGSPSAPESTHRADPLLPNLRTEKDK